MVALFLLSVGFATFMTFQGDVFRSRGFSIQHTEALNIAKDKIEQLRQTAADSTAQDLTSGNSIIKGKSARYTLDWTITKNENPTYDKVSVMVSWKDAAGEMQTVRLDTILIEPNHDGEAAIKQGLQ